MNKFVMVLGILMTVTMVAVSTYRFGFWGFVPSAGGGMAISLFWLGFVEEMRDRVDIARERVAEKRRKLEEQMAAEEGENAQV